MGGSSSAVPILCDWFLHPSHSVSGVHQKLTGVGDLTSGLRRPANPRGLVSRRNLLGECDVELAEDRTSWRRYVNAGLGYNKLTRSCGKFR